MKTRTMSGRTRALWAVGATAVAVVLGVVSVSAAQGAKAGNEQSRSDVDQRVQKLKNLGVDEVDPSQLQDDPEDPNLVPEVTDESPEQVHHEADSVTDSDS